ncbi:phosphatidate cytidylyltransferase [Alsobacter sp. SYSU BS001988]
MSDPAPEAVKPPKGPSELTLRVLSGVVMAALAIGTAWIDGWSFGLFWTVAAVLVLREWLSLIGLGGTRMTVCWTVGGLAIAFAGTMAEVSEAPEPRAWAAVLAGALLVAALAPSRRGWAAAGVVYAAVLAVAPIDLRGDPSFGVVAIFWMFAVVWITDIAAYFVGRSVGGPKLCPRVSPKKTWSGFIGGVAGGTLAGLAVVHVARSSYGLGWTFGGFGLVALTLGSAILSQGGDLFESSMKRRFGAKDSSHLIPGHGGVMDRLDSFWAVSVVLAVLLYASLPA